MAGAVRDGVSLARPRSDVTTLWVLHPYVPDTRHTGRQQATWTALAAARARWPVVDVPVGRDGRYEASFRAAWQRGTDFCVCEQDVEPALWHLEALARCPEPVCAWAYAYGLDPAQEEKIRAIADAMRRLPPDELLTLRTYPVVSLVLDWTGPEVTPVVHRHWTPNGPARMAVPGDAYADLAGFGLIRFRGSLCAAHPPAWEPGPWGTLDTRVTAWLRTLGIPIHLHWGTPWPVHPHNCRCHRNDPATRGPTVFRDDER